MVNATNDIATLNIAFATVTNTCVNTTIKNSCAINVAACNKPLLQNAIILSNESNCFNQGQCPLR